MRNKNRIAHFLVLTGLVLITFTRPLISGMTYSWSNTYIQTATLLIFGVWLIGKEKPFRLTPLGLPLLSFFLILTISTIFSVNIDASIKQLYQFSSYLLLYFIVVNNVETARERRIIVTVLLISTVLVCAYGIYQRFGGLERTRQIVRLYHAGEFAPEFMTRLGTEKIFSTFVFPPALAGFIILILPLSLSVLLSKIDIPSRILAGVVCAGAFMCLFFTFSKGGWLASLISLILWSFIFFGRRSRRHLTKIIIVNLLIITVICISFFCELFPQVTPGGFTGSFKFRLAYWKAGMAMVRDYTPIGSGPGTFGSIYAKYRIPGAEETQMAHNNYLQVASELGLGGLLTFLWGCIVFLTAGWRVITKRVSSLTFTDTGAIVIGSYVGIIAFLIHSIADFNLYIPGITTNVFLLGGLLMGSEAPRSEGRIPKGRTLPPAVTILLTAGLIFAVRMPLVSERYFKQGIKANKIKKTEPAVANLQKACFYGPFNAEYHFTLGTIYKRAGMDAIPQYEKAVRCNPGMPYYHSQLGWAYWQKGKGKNRRLIEKAVYELEQAVSYYPTIPRYHIQLGRLFQLCGRYKDAKSEYLLAISLRDEVYRSRAVEETRLALKQVEKWLKEME